MRIASLPPRALPSPRTTRARDSSQFSDRLLVPVEIGKFPIDPRPFPAVDFDIRVDEVIERLAALARRENQVTPGGEVNPVLIEVAARTHLLKEQGYAPARELVEKLDRELARRGSSLPESSDG